MLGPWSASALAGDRQNAAPKKEAQVAPKKATTSSLGPWSARLLGTPKESRSQSRSQGVDDSKPLGPWSEASQKGQAASQRVDGVDESKTLGPWSEPSQKGRSAQQKRTATSDQSRPLKKARRVDLTQACVMDIPHHVRGHAVPVSKKTERAKDPKAIKKRYSGNGRCVCAKHKAQKAPPCHRRVPLVLILQLCCALAGMSTEEKAFIFYHMYMTTHFYLF